VKKIKIGNGWTGEEGVHIATGTVILLRDG
jgi:hypothetical protein